MSECRLVRGEARRSESTEYTATARLGCLHKTHTCTHNKRGRALGLVGGWSRLPPRNTDKHTHAYTCTRCREVGPGRLSAADERRSTEIGLAMARGPFRVEFQEASNVVLARFEAELCW